MMNKFKLTSKILIIFLITGLIPMLIITAISYTQARSSIEDEVYSKMELFAELKEEEINKYLAEKMVFGLTLADTARVYNAVKVYNDEGGNSPLWQETYRALDAFLPTYTDRFEVLSIYIIGADGLGIYGTGTYKSNIEGSDFSIREYFKQSMAGIQNISEFAFSGIINDYYIAVATPIRENGTGDVIGTVNMYLPVDLIDSMVHEGVYKIGDTGDSYLIDSKGLLHTNTKLGAYAQGAAFNQTINTYASQTLSSQINQRNVDFHHTNAYADYLGNNVLGTMDVITIGATNLGLVIEVDSAEVLAGANRLLILVIGVAAIIVLLSIILVVFLGRGIAKPIKTIEGVAAKMAV